MASIEGGITVDARIGLDGPAGEAVSLLREFVAVLGDHECCRSCYEGSDCLCSRAKAFLDAIDAATDPKGAA